MKRFIISAVFFSSLTPFVNAAYAEDKAILKSFDEPKYKEAKPLDVKLSGFIDLQFGYADVDNQPAGTRDFALQNDTEIHFEFSGATNSGIEYGAVIELEADVSEDGDDEGVNADKTYIFVEGEKGRVELGNNAGVEDLLKIGPETIAFGTGGIDGDFYDFVDVTDYLYSPDLLPQFRRGTAEDATKLTYLTPIFSGVQVGVSYTPDLGDGGSAPFSGDNNSFEYENVFSAAASYTESFGDVALQLYLAGLVGSAEVNTEEDLESFAAGIAIHYQAFSLAASYADWGEYTDPTFGVSEAEFFTLGAAYEIGPAGISVTYLNSENGAGDFENIVVGTSIEAFPGFTPYFELNFFEKTPALAGSEKEDGFVLLSGTEILF